MSRLEYPTWHLVSILCAHESKLLIGHARVQSGTGSAVYQGCWEECVLGIRSCCPAFATSLVFMLHKVHGA